MSRTGKIARLPRSIRDELNQRLTDGEAGPQLVTWLNGRPAVQEAMEEHFNSRPVTEQNLSEWRQGGYEDWLRQEEACGRIRSLAVQAESLGQAAD